MADIAASITPVKIPASSVGTTPAGAGRRIWTLSSADWNSTSASSPVSRRRRAQRWWLKRLIMTE
jgi:hypothetical protein